MKTIFWIAATAIAGWLGYEAGNGVGYAEGAKVERAKRLRAPMSVEQYADKIISEAHEQGFEISQISRAEDVKVIRELITVGDHMTRVLGEWPAEATDVASAARAWCLVADKLRERYA